jgi:flagellar biosynthesis chaperone FliJ
MKPISISLTCALLAVGAFGQNATKSASQKAGTTDQEIASDRDLNLRAYIELLRGDVKKAKSQVMATVMQLDAEQAAKFWPIYKEFELELARIGDQIVTVVHDYAANYENLTPPVADQLATKILSIEQQRNELKRKYYLQVKAGLDAITAARFLQVENQLERLVDLQIAAELPVIRAR